ncbi:MAG TPA: hypothetical protein DCP02_00580 [Actinobacteria bacterium]|nr:hypothetical protein [Actinomycetota bacterium]
MSSELVFYIAMVLFLISIFGLFVSADIISVFIMYQLIVIAAIINFLNFSIYIGTGQLWIKVFLIIGLLSVYLLVFAVFFYIYSNTEILERKAIIKDHRLFKLEKSDWWGEDNI